MVEVFKDRALGLPPLNATLALRMMERTRIFAAIQGATGRGANVRTLEQLLVRFSQLVVEQKSVAEIDVNPLLVTADRIFALDARVVLHEAGIPADRLPTTAIRPYPSQYSGPWKLRNRALVIIRPIRPEDEPLMVTFHETLSEESVYHRYFSALKLSQRVAHERLTRICFNDYDREIALVAELVPLRGKQREIIGVGRLSKLHAVNEAEFAILISDKWQKQGLGTELLKRLVQVSRDERLDRITAVILPDNYAMQHVSRKAGFKITHEAETGELIAEYIL
jgi:acetyltransferase